MERKQTPEEVERTRRFLNALLRTEGRELEKLSRTQAKKSLELIRGALHKDNTKKPDRKYYALCYVYDMMDVAERDICDRVKDVAILSIVELRKNDKFLKQLKHVLQRTLEKRIA
ncbi:hypothetical protein IKG33_03010 [Candidatus Saccharibacteria bacterium]|nr:hypothetical protein [Candidatus Saccharibacteria bacterium]